MTAEHRRLAVLMVGPDPSACGGIASVIRIYQEHGFPADVRVSYLATYVDGPRRRKLWFALRSWLVVAVRMRKTDVVHVHTSSGKSFLRKAVLLSLVRLRRTHTVLHVHGSDFDKFVAGPARPLVRAVLTRVDLVVALSAHWQEILLSVAPSANVAILRNGVRIPDRPADVSAGPFVSLGRLGERKGSFDIIEAVRLLEPGHPQIVLAGDGDVGALRAQVERERLNGRLEIREWLNASECTALLGQASAFVLPSRAEGLPMALLEAMAHGLPVISTPVGGIPEAIKDGENGIVVPPGEPRRLAEALQRLAQDHELRARLGASARRCAEATFDLNGTVSGLCRLWKECAWGREEPTTETSLGRSRPPA